LIHAQARLKNSDAAKILRGFWPQNCILYIGGFFGGKMPKQIVGVTRFIVMRSPCLMEDEGRHFYIKSFTSKMKAKEWIAKQKGQYFSPEDYYICEQSV
jgi:hypothetical protein